MKYTTAICLLIIILIVDYLAFPHIEVEYAYILGLLSFKDCESRIVLIYTISAAIFGLSIPLIHYNEVGDILCVLECRSIFLLVLLGSYLLVMRQLRLNNITRKQASQLETNNKELERIIWATSHDLQEPLANIQSFSTLMEKKYSQMLDQTAFTYLHFIENSSSKMRGMVQSLLIHARLGIEEQSVDVDLNLILKKVIVRNKHKIEETGAQISCDNLPVIYGKPEKIKVLFCDLIDNSTKFIRHGIKPRIVIRSSTDKHGWLFEFEDNGTGIDPEFIDDIFSIFSSRQCRVSHAGFGIGLAHCRKVIEQHNGEIWAENNEENGVTIKFFIPRLKRTDKK